MIDNLTLTEMKDEIFRKFGFLKNFVVIEVDANAKYPASAWGFTIGLNIISPEVLGPFGRITLSKDLINILTSDELRFIIGHEAAHIVRNHLITNVNRLYNSFKEFVDKLSEAFPWAFLLKGLLQLNDFRNLLQFALLGKLPLRVEITKEQEIQADIDAIKIIGNKEVAFSCLKKLVNNNLDTPSHLWEALDVKLPVMTMRERIEEINKRLSDIF